MRVVAAHVVERSFDPGVVARGAIVRARRIVVLTDASGRSGLGELRADDAVDGSFVSWERGMPILPWLAAQTLPLGCETALLDLIGQETQRPIWSLLDADAAGAVHISALVDNATDVAAAVERGVKTFKYKIGPSAELATQLDHARRITPVTATLRLDANRQLQPTPATLALLEGAGAEFVEEPFAACYGFASMPFAVALDESLLDADNAFDRPFVRAVILKPSVLGSYARTLALADRARTSGKRVVVTHAFEGPIGFAAACHVAWALRSYVDACGLYPYPGVARTASSIAHGILRAQQRAGLGVAELG
jgi:L-alanine-DL-glutamate epimerase-like enolase superfamily enzyme